VDDPCINSFASKLPKKLMLIGTTLIIRIRILISKSFMFYIYASANNTLGSLTLRLLNPVTYSLAFIFKHPSTE
jgi:hypothetical protein